MKKHRDKFSILFMYKWAGTYLSKYKGLVFISIIMMLLYITLNLIQVDYIKRMIDAALEKDIRSIFQILLVFVMITGTGAVKNYFSGRTSKLLTENITRDLKNDLANKLLKLKLKNISDFSSGDLVSRHNTDLRSIISFIPGCYSDLLFTPLMALAGFGYLLTISWKLSLVAFATSPILAVVLNYMSKRSSSINGKRLEIKGHISEHIKETADGQEVIKAYKLKSGILKKGNSLFENLKQIDLKYKKNDSFTTALILSVSYFPSILLLIYGGYLVINGEIMLSELFAFTQLATLVTFPAIMLFSSFRNLKLSMGAMKRIDEIFALENERTDGKDFTIETATVIQFDNVSFSYDGNSEILSDINFSIESGKCIGVVGSSGEGKTTIINLISGFYQVREGRIKLFNKQVSDWKLASLRNKYGYVSQDTVLFPDTILENIRYGLPRATDEQVIKAAVNAGVNHFAKQLPKQYHTLLHENGTGISGGERQRIALARVFLRNPPVILLDEPTSSLDVMTEKQILENLKLLIKDKSVLLVTHRMSALALCDKIYLLKGGKFVESGSHVDLIKKKGAYFKLFDKQLHEYGENNE